MSNVKRIINGVEYVPLEYHVKEIKAQKALINKARIEEWKPILKAKITHGGSPAPFNPEGLPISTPRTEEMTKLLQDFARNRISELKSKQKEGKNG